jgi:CBS domain-containing protein
MRVERIMRRNVQCVARTATVREAARLMRDHRVGFLPVVGPDFRVCGAVTDRDLVVRALANGWAGDTLVGEVMSPDVIGVRPDDPLAEAERKMTQWRKNRLMVLDEDGRCCGVVSLSDLARHGSRPTVPSAPGGGPWRITEANFRRRTRRA